LSDIIIIIIINDVLTNNIINQKNIQSSSL